MRSPGDAPQCPVLITSPEFEGEPDDQTTTRNSTALRTRLGLYRVRNDHLCRSGIGNFEGKSDPNDYPKKIMWTEGTPTILWMSSN